MAKFISKKHVTMIIESANQVIIPNTSGVPQVVNTPERKVELHIGTNVFDDVADKEKIARIRRAQRFGTNDLREITADDEEEIKMKEEALKEVAIKLQERKKGKLEKVDKKEKKDKKDE